MSELIDNVFRGLGITITSETYERGRQILEDVRRHGRERFAELRGGVRRSPECTARIRAEIHLVAPRFAKHDGVDYDEANCDWLMIPSYPLPERRWRARFCKLMVIFPSAYPLTPPVGFFLNHKLTLRNGFHDGHLIGTGLHGAPDISAHQWFWYCVTVNEHARGGWHPSSHYDEPDNLHTYLDLVREVLTND